MFLKVRKHRRRNLCTVTRWGTGGLLLNYFLNIIIFQVNVLSLRGTIWAVGSMGCWPNRAAEPMDYRTNGLPDQWAVGQIECRTNELSDQWAVGPIGCRKMNGLLDQWAVGVMMCHIPYILGYLNMLNKGSAIYLSRFLLLFVFS